MSTRYAHTRLHPYRLGDVVNVVAGSRVKTSRSLSLYRLEAAMNPYRIHNTRFRMKKRTCPFPNFLAVQYFIKKPWTIVLARPQNGGFLYGSWIDVLSALDSVYNHLKYNGAQWQLPFLQYRSSVTNAAATFLRREPYILAIFFCYDISAKKKQVKCCCFASSKWLYDIARESRRFQSFYYCAKM